MEPRLGTTRHSAAKTKPLAGIIRISRETLRYPQPNQQVAFLHEATNPVVSCQYSYEHVSENYDGCEAVFIVEETDPVNSIVTSNLPSTIYERASSAQDATDTSNSEQLLLLERNGYARKREVRVVYSSSIMHENARSNRVCWLAKVI